ncbi:MAG TPA: sigma-70 family RNA polymerase sigma factor [Burkholderiales bacterium]|nr:sigma-70 family RNA polymerase sigma factor [Burkholderiales bacterium]
MTEIKICAGLTGSMKGMCAATPDFQVIHADFRPRVLRYLSRLAGEAEAEDLTQSVMLKVSEGLRQFRGDSSVSTWIYRIATNAALDRLRHKTIQATDEAVFDSDEGDVPPEAQIESVEASAVREEMSSCIREFIERLPENYKTVMLLSELEGFKNSEIASILGITLDAVKIRLHRAREKLRKDLEDGCSFYRDEGDELACDRKPAATITFRPRGG